ncbi:hypothetical protein F5X98DRAFT_336613 [Xylaria grammica]|nr:hypothetical protein F5X98DRAFT_336613 [Xylaria grammica]
MAKTGRGRLLPHWAWAAIITAARPHDRTTARPHDTTISMYCRWSTSLLSVARGTRSCAVTVYNNMLCLCT